MRRVSYILAGALGLSTAIVVSSKVEAQSLNNKAVTDLMLRPAFFDRVRGVARRCAGSPRPP